MTTRAYVHVAGGQVHIAEDGAGLVVLLLHQTPRSWDEYRDVLPLIAEGGRRAVAMDTPGYGASDPLDEADTIEGYAQVALGLLDALGVEQAAVVGHHTGGVIAVELAARAPRRVSHLVLSSTPCVDAEFRGRPGYGVDDVAGSADGSHLVALWQGRQSFYPADRPDLLERFVKDALAAGRERSAAGHAAVRAYHMENRLCAIEAQTLLVGATADPFGHPNLARLAAAMPAAECTEIDGGMVPLPDQLPERYAEVVLDFVGRR